MAVRGESDVRIQSGLDLRAGSGCTMLMSRSRSGGGKRGGRYQVQVSCQVERETVEILPNLHPRPSNSRAKLGIPLHELPPTETSLDELL